MGLRKFLPFGKDKPKVSVIRLSGVIGSGPRQGLSFSNLREMMDAAFSKGKPVAVAIVINSPGGSPTQSALIADHLRRLADEKEVPLYAFVEDVAASGGYWLAVAADEIYADPSSMIGSIGVISSGFGLQDFISRYGIERRVHTAGTSKSMLDPFRAENPDDVARLNTLLGDLHTLFIDHIKSRRGKYLCQETNLFEGDVWLGAKAKSLGLIDDLGHIEPVMRDKLGKDVQFRYFTIKKPFFRRFSGQVMDALFDGLEERAQFARFGL